jgi:hypothetical protein
LLTARARVGSDDAAHVRRLFDEQITETLIDHTVDCEVLMSGGDEEEARMCANPLVRRDIEQHRVNTAVVAAFTEKLERALVPCERVAHTFIDLSKEESVPHERTKRLGHCVPFPLTTCPGNGDLSSAARP